MIDAPKTLLDRTQRSPLSLIWRIVLGPLDIYAGILLMYCLLRLISREALWPVALINVMLHWLLLPALVMFPILLIARRWRRAIGWGALTGVYLLLFVGLFLPRISSPSCEGTCQTLRLMEFNIGENLVDEEALLDLLSSSDADIIGLIEIAPEQEPLLDSLKDDYPYQATGGRKAILSRYPIQNSEVVDVVWEHYPAFLVSTLDIDGTLIRVILFHNHVPRLGGYVDRWAYHTWRGGENLSLDYPVGDIPTLILADLNGTDQNADVRELYRVGYHDAFRQAGWGYGLTFPARQDGWRDLKIPPLVRIDYILMSDHFSAASAGVGEDSAGSDHRPVWAELYLQPEGQLKRVSPLRVIR